MNHARQICLLLAVLFMLTAVFGACEPGTDDGSGTGPDEATGSGGSGGDGEDDPNADYTVYHTQCFGGDCVYYVNEDPSSALTNLVFTLFEYPGEAYHVCQVPTCYHNFSSYCDFKEVEPFCVVQRDGELPLVYMQKGMMVYVYNSETGGVKRVGRTDLFRANDTWFYRDKLYMCGGLTIPGHPSPVVSSLDTVTGDFEYLDIDLKASMYGIYNDRVWFITDRNMICSCALDFSDVREEYDVGIDEKNSDTEYRYTLRGYIDGGMIYFERNRREPEKFPGDAFINESNGGNDLKNTVVSDVCVLDADNIGAGERTVAEGVIDFKPKGGDLYYSKMDYDHYEESETYVYSGIIIYEDMPDNKTKTYRFDGGTLYRYDHESGKSVTVIEDCGTNFSVLQNHSFVSFAGAMSGGIIDITDDYVLFRGRQYRDLDDELKDRDCCNYICQIDLKTGEWRVIVPRANLPLNEIF